MIIRDCECMACGHQFIWPVKTGQEISGEAPIICPACQSRNTFGGPHVLLKFEREVCSRCGGSGSYSYCQRWGSTCFKCAGRKEVLTKRGQAASNYCRELRSRRMDELEVGQWFRETSITMGGSVYEDWFQIEEIEKGITQSGKSWVNGVEQPKVTGLVNIKAKGKISGPITFTEFAGGKRVRVFISKDEDLRTLKEAIAYQATLTKQGTPRKRAR